MYTPEKQTIKGRTYTVKRQLGGLDASSLWLSLAEAAGPILFPMIKAVLQGTADPAALFQALIGNNTAGGAMLSNFAGELRPLMPTIAPLVFAHVHCDRAKIGDSEVPADLAERWDHHFTGRMAVDDLWRVAFLVLTANFEMPSTASPSSESTKSATAGGSRTPSPSPRT